MLEGDYLVKVPKRVKEINDRLEKDIESIPRGGIDIARRLFESDSRRRQKTPVLSDTPVKTTSPGRPGGSSLGRRGTGGSGMEAREALETVVNSPDIQVSPELMAVINDPSMLMTRNGEITRRIGFDSRQFELQNVLPVKKKRKISKYQKEFGRQLKLLKKKFPRTPVTKLMKRAHSATRKAMK